MDITPQQRSLFETIFDAPTGTNINKVTPMLFPYFVAYLYSRDGLYTPKHVDGKGDHGVDIELHARDGIDSELIGVVQCKRVLGRKIKPDEIIVFANAMLAANVNRGYYFTYIGYTPAASREAREHYITLYTLTDIQNWITDIRRREINARRQDNIPHPDELTIPIICLANNKGGVGKTTSAVNIAVEFAATKPGVLVIDMDPQKHATFWLRPDARTNESSIYEVLIRNYPIHPFIQTTFYPGVWVLPGSHTLEDLAHDTQQYAFERKLTKALGALAFFDPPIHTIIIDTPPALGALTAASLIASSHLLIPMNRDILSNQGLTRLLSVVEEVESRHQRRPLQIIGGIATRVDKRTNEAKFYEREIPKLALQHSRMQGFTTPFWCGVLQQKADYPRAAGEHKAIRTLTPRSTARSEVNLLAKEIQRRVYNFSRRTYI